MNAATPKRSSLLVAALKLEPALSGREIAVFVSGHTHAPSLTRLARSSVGNAVAVNSGCWLRQLRPVHAHFGGPPVFVSTFVQTHVRVFLTPAKLCAELWSNCGRTVEIPETRAATPAGNRTLSGSRTVAHTTQRGGTSSL